MTTIIIDEKSKKGRIILDLIREMNCGKIVVEGKNTKETPNEITRLAIRETEQVETIKCLNFDDYLLKVK